MNRVRFFHLCGSIGGVHFLSLFFFFVWLFQLAAHFGGHNFGLEEREKREKMKTIEVKVWVGSRQATFTGPSSLLKEIQMRKLFANLASSHHDYQIKVGFPFSTFFPERSQNDC